MAAGHVYHWKHGWIPLDHAAALSKAKGNHERAAAMLADARSHDAGINNKRDVAKAALDLPNVHDSAGRQSAKAEITAAAHEHGATSVLPGSFAPTRSSQLEAAAAKKHAEADRIFGNTGVSDMAATRLNAHNLAQVHKNTDSSLRRYTEATNQAAALEHKAGLAKGREVEAARTRLTHEDVKGARAVKDRFGWHTVVRVNAKTVTVKTPYSWTETIPHEKIHQVLM